MPQQRPTKSSRDGHLPGEREGLVASPIVIAGSYESTLDELIASAPGIPDDLRAELLDARATERRQAEAELRLSEERFTIAFRASPDALAISHLDGRLIEINDTWQRL